MARSRFSPLPVLGLGLALLAGCQQDKAPAQRFHGPLIASRFRCADFRQPIYFEAGQSAITQQADRLLNAAVARTRRCAVTGVSIVGLADSSGAPDANMALSQQRADAVRAELHAKGLDKVEIDVKAVGSAVASTPSGQRRPVRRRAVVTFHLASPS